MTYTSVFFNQYKKYKGKKYSQSTLLYDLLQVHWLFVMITCSAVIAGFAVIFVGVDGISQLFEVSWTL